MFARIALSSIIAASSLSAAVQLAPTRYDAVRLNGGYFVTATSNEQTVVAAVREQPSRITVTRIGDGVEIDRPALTVASGPLAPRSMSLASDGRDFILARDCAAGVVCTTKIAADGTVGPERRWTNGYIPEIIWTGTDYLIAFHWQWHYRFFRLSRDGEQASPVTIGERSASFALAAADDGFLMAYWQEGRIVVERHTSDGRLAPFVVANAPPSRIRIEKGRDGYLVAWMSRRNTDGRANLHFAEISSDFRVSAPVQVVDGIADVYGPDVEILGSGYLIAFAEKVSNGEDARLRMVEVREGLLASSRATTISHLSVGTPLFAHLRPNETHLMYPVTSAEGVTSVASSRIESDLRIGTPAAVITEAAEPFDASACLDSNGIGFAAWTEKVGLLARSQIFFGELTGEEPHVEIPRALASGSVDQRFPQLNCAGPAPSILWAEDAIAAKTAELKFGLLGASIRDVLTIATDVRASTRFSYDWNGSAYLIGYSEAEGRFVTRLFASTSRIVSSPRPLSDTRAPDGYGDVWLRAGAGGFFAIWHTLYPEGCQITCPAPRPRFRARTLSTEGIAVSPEIDLRHHFFSEDAPPALDWDVSHFLLVSSRQDPYTRSPSITIFSPTGVEVARRELHREAGLPGILFVRPDGIVAVSVATELPSNREFVMESRFTRDYVLAGGSVAHRLQSPRVASFISAIRASTGRMHYILRARDAIHGHATLYVHTLPEDFNDRRRTTRKGP